MPSVAFSAVAAYYDLLSQELDERGSELRNSPPHLVHWKTTKSYLPAQTLGLKSVLLMKDPLPDNALILLGYVTSALTLLLSVVFDLQHLTTHIWYDLCATMLLNHAAPCDLPMWRCHVCSILMDDDDLIISCPDCFMPVHRACSSRCIGRCGLQVCNRCLSTHPCQWRDHRHRDPPVITNWNIALNDFALFDDPHLALEIKTLRNQLLDLPTQPLDINDSNAISRPPDLFPLLPYQRPRYDFLISLQDRIGTNDVLLINPTLLFSAFDLDHQRMDWERPDMISCPADLIKILAALVILSLLYQEPDDYLQVLLSNIPNIYTLIQRINWNHYDMISPPAELCMNLPALVILLIMLTHAIYLKQHHPSAASDNALFNPCDSRRDLRAPAACWCLAAEAPRNVQPPIT